ncbi:hypothetical protein [Acetobacter senegalensis]|uniref:hypothetical protein n=1 Tax=Acetobacter senegalensis TaxID=446692 RepID=UPI001EDB7575|nr:hypothetical protein [Acetobacter senegalensis]MCG4254265.1 hypothetical protein [Acetobacter senegalensis]MCG4258217.1 hypothetical protein [Acetobacter senegalensis]MCG4268144.1 hypothetical protein [Acetobacter senegalensis]
MDPTTVLTSVFNYVLPMLPSQWAAAASVIGSFVVSSCALAAYFWPRPKDGSKWLPLYEAINKLGLNGKHAANADDTAAKTLPKN